MAEPVEFESHLRFHSGIFAGGCPCASKMQGKSDRLGLPAPDIGARIRDMRLVDRIGIKALTKARAAIPGAIEKSSTM